MCKTAGFNVTDYHGDNEFNCIREFLRPATLHTHAKGEHVGQIEIKVWTVKQRTRWRTNGIPCWRHPKLIVVKLVERMSVLLNMFPSKNEISKTMSPANVVLGIPNFDRSVKRIARGSHAQVFQGTENITKSRLVPEIALIGSNKRGGTHVMNLCTGEAMHSCQWYEPPITDKVIDQVEQLAEDERAPLLKKWHFNF